MPDRHASALTRGDHQRRVGSLGELDTVVERLNRAIEIRGEEELPRWEKVRWFLEQLIREADRIGGYTSGTPHTIAGAMVRNLYTLGDLLNEIDLCGTEAHAEIQGAAHHVDEARSSVRLDQLFADQWRLQAAGLDEWSVSRPTASDPARGVA